MHLLRGWCSCPELGLSCGSRGPSLPQSRPHAVTPAVPGREGRAGPGLQPRWRHAGPCPERSQGEPGAWDCSPLSRLGAGGGGCPERALETSVAWAPRPSLSVPLSVPHWEGQSPYAWLGHHPAGPWLSPACQPSPPCRGAGGSGGGGLSRGLTCRRPSLRMQLPLCLWVLPPWRGPGPPPPSAPTPRQALRGCGEDLDPDSVAVGDRPGGALKSPGVVWDGQWDLGSQGPENSGRPRGRGGPHGRPRPCSPGTKTPV